MQVLVTIVQRVWAVILSLGLLTYPLTTRDLPHPGHPHPVNNPPRDNNKPPDNHSSDLDTTNYTHEERRV